VFILSLHGADLESIRTGRNAYKRIWQSVMESADAVTACSEDLARQTREFAPRARVFVVHNGVDVGLFRAAQRGGGPRTILHVGKFEHKKGQDVLLAAFRRLADRLADARLHLVGATGPTLESVQHQVTALGLTGRVRLDVDVPHERIPTFMAEASLFVLPSRREPFGVVLLEAGAAALPVVATRVGGIPELMQDGRTGLLVEPDDPRQLEDALYRVLTDEALAATLADQCMQPCSLDGHGTAPACGIWKSSRRPGGFRINSMIPVRNRRER
jgi:glycosyltransferase involved in cell wall biosynthesis